jgi:hypothetical protein
MIGGAIHVNGKSLDQWVGDWVGGAATTVEKAVLDRPIYTDASGEQNSV